MAKEYNRLLPKKREDIFYAHVPTAIDKAFVINCTDSYVSACVHYETYVIHEDIPLSLSMKPVVFCQQKIYPLFNLNTHTVEFYLDNGHTKPLGGSKRVFCPLTFVKPRLCALSLKNGIAIATAIYKLSEEAEKHTERNKISMILSKII